MHTEELQIKIGQTIKTLRLDKELTQEDMAKLLHLCRNAYSDIELGKTDICISRLTQIANFFGVEVTLLLGSTVNQNVTNNNQYQVRAKSRVRKPQINHHSHCHIYSAEEKLQHTLEKQALVVELKDKELAMKDREIAYLTELLDMHKQQKPISP